MIRAVAMGAVSLVGLCAVAPQTLGHFVVPERLLLGPRLHVGGQR